MGLFCEHSDVFLETWPTSGMTRAGMAYALPTWAHRTDGSASSSSPLLPTPRAQEPGATNEGYGLSLNEALTGGRKPKTACMNLDPLVKELATTDPQLLPTPTTGDYKDSQVRREPHRPDDTDTLSRALADLL